MKFWIYALVISLVFGQTVRLPGGVLPTDIIALGAVGYWVFEHLRVRTWPQLPKVQTLIIGALITWGGISLTFNLHTLPRHELFGPLSYLLRIATYLVLVFPLSEWFSKNPRKYLSVWEVSLMWSTLVLIILGFLQLIFIPDFSFMAQYGWDPHMGRLLSTWYDPNFFAGYLSVVTPLFLARVFEDRRQKNWNKTSGYALGVTVLSSIAVILTLSRSGLLAFMTGMLGVTLVYAPLTIIGIVIVLSGTLAVNQRFRERVMGIFQIDVTASLRIQSWVQTIQDIEKAPWIGVGYNTLRYQNILPENLNSGSGRDSSLLTIWLTTGIIGLILVIAMIIERVITFLLLAKSKDPIFRRWGISGLSALAALLVHSMFVNSMTYIHILVILIMYLSINHDSKASHT
mgnify:CR=1 FL=1